MSDAAATKPVYQSKTLWANLILALAPFIPGATEFLLANPDLIPWTFAAVNIVLRLITKDKVSLT